MFFYIDIVKTYKEEKMSSIDWLTEIHNRKDSFIKDLQGLLQIKSVLDEENATEDAPFGVGVKEALTYMLQLVKKMVLLAKM